MKRLILLCFAINLSVSYGQDNTLPQTGNVGIGTLSPTARLSVNGRAVIDSALVVKDSINVQKDLIVEENVRIEGKLVVYDNSVARSNFKIKGDLKLPNIASDPNTTRVLMLDANDNAREIDFNTFAERVIDFGYSPYPNTLNICELVDYTDAPVWQNGPYKIYSECQQVNVGIATRVPRVNLDVLGTTFSRKLALGVADPVNSLGYFDLVAPFTSLTSGQSVFNIRNSNGSLFSVNNSGLTTAYKLNAAGVYIDMVNLPSGEQPFVIKWDTEKLLQLDATGLLRTRAVKVNLEQWPDYVFDDNYQLKPLEELKQFIEEKGHLPGIESAEEIEGEGVDLGEMNKKLLEKIEELTLYLIQQNEEIKDLKSQIGELQNDTKAK